jgi:hypothetical protein
MSWRNLLSWKKRKMIVEDFENFIRLAHTIEKQIFDPKSYSKKKTRLRRNEAEVEVKIFEVLDMFIRESSLGQF